MLATVTCTQCGHRFSVPEIQVGRNVVCPNCQSAFVAGSTPTAEPKAASAAAQAVNVAPAARLVAASKEVTIRYSCPRCKKPLESPAIASGKKIHCPACSQRLQIPQPPPEPVADFKIGVADEIVPVVMPPKQPSTVVRTIHKESTPKTQCLECGRKLDAGGQQLTCPNCGSLFCSSSCFREHDYHAHGRGSRR